MKRAVVLAWVLLPACTGDVGSRLVVDLRTDVQPGREFIDVRVAVDGAPDAGAPRQTDRPAYLGDDYFAGLRVSELDGLSSGPHHLRVSLLDTAMHEVITRDVDVTLTGDLAVTVVVSRDCRGVVCAPGLSCYAGRCGGTTCTMETPEACTSECATAADCAPMATCSDVLCQSGACLYRPVDTRCPSGERCDLDVGCVTDVGPCPAGTRACGDVCRAACTFTFDSPSQTVWQVPRGCENATFHAWGAGGMPATNGGAGGYASATLALAAGEPLVVVVGGHTSDPGGAGTGGHDGGGYSGIFRGAVDRAGAVLIAGGGGGAGLLSSAQGGAGGGATAEPGGAGSSATQTAAGGSGATAGSDLHGGAGAPGTGGGGGGGGGGYFGGGGGLVGARSAVEAGGGGSGWVAMGSGVTTAGVGTSPGNAADAHRGGAGAPGAIGRVVVDCF